MRVAEASSGAAARLSSAGVPDSSLEAELLIRHTLDLDRVGYFSSLTQAMTRDEEERVGLLARRRMSGEPLAYILGQREFYGLDLIIDSNVLVPRQETEALVEEVIRFARARPGERVTIADIGTGSGAIAVALASSLPEASLQAVDTSRGALNVARANSGKHCVSDRVELLHGDLLEPLGAAVDVIVSNPPYLRSGDVPGLAPEVRAEPSLALDGGEDGLDFTRRLFENAPRYLKPRGAMFVEIDPRQLDDATALARNAFPSAETCYSSDLLGLPRVVWVEV